MDAKRAEQIIASKHNIPVYYKNTPVWLYSINKDKLTAEVKNLNTDNFTIVSLKTLNEIS